MVGAGPPLTDVQARDLEALQNKPKRTELQEKKMQELIAKRDAGPELSAGAKTYIEEEFYKDYFNYDFRFSNKYTRKGNELEQRSIRQVGEFLGYPFATKATPEYMENEFICTSGYDWKVKGFVFDQKNVWEPKGLKLFDNDKDLPVYEWQIRGYAMLLNELKGEDIKAGAIIRTLMNPPQDEAMKQARLLWVEAGNNWTDPIDESFIDDVANEFDFEGKMPSIADRIRIHKVEATEEHFALIRAYVGLAKEHYSGLFDKVKSVNKDEILFFSNK